MCWLWSVLLLMLAIVCCQGLGWSSWMESLSAVSGDNYYFIGETLKLECTVSNDSQNASKFRFFHTVKSGSSRRCVPPTYIQVTSSVSASLIIPQVNLSHSGVYTCYQDDSPCVVDKLENVNSIDMSDDIIIEYPPENVTNFQCVVFNWNEAMNCSWQHSKNYINWSNIRVTSGYIPLNMANHEPMTAYTCPRQDNNSCFWNSDQFFNTIYVVEVNVTNLIKNKIASHNFLVNTSCIVKPDPVTRLTARAEPNKPGCISLSWQHSKPYRDKIYRIEHNVVGKDKYKTAISDLRETNMTVCDYAPYTHHNFTVACHPATDDGFWSEVEYVDVWTSMAAPYTGPRTWNGSFTTTNCVSDARNVRVMWQDVIESDRNGIIKGYSLYYKGQLVAQSASSEYQTTITLDCSSNSVLQLYAFNDAGSSQKPTILVVPPVTFSVPQSVKDSFAVELPSENNQTSINATWDLGDAVVQNFTLAIFWCSSSSTKTCENHIQRQVVPTNQTFCELPISPDRARNYLFGVSVTSSSLGMSSGIFWTRCLYWRNPEQVQSVDSLNVHGEAESVRVSWAPYVCSYENQVRPSKIVVKWCQATEGTESHCKDGTVVEERDVPPSNSFYTVSPLKAKAYLFTVQPVSQNVEGSEVQPWKKAVPFEKVADKNYFWFLLFLPLGLLILCPFLYKACQGARNRAKLWHHDEEPQIMPKAVHSANQQQLNDNMPPEERVPAVNSQTFANPVLPDGILVIQDSYSGHNVSDPVSGNSQTPLLKLHHSDPKTGLFPSDVLSRNADNTTGTNMKASNTEDYSNLTYLKQVPFSSNLEGNKMFRNMDNVKAIYEENFQEKTFNNEVKFVPVRKSSSPAPDNFANKILFLVKHEIDDSHSLQAAATKSCSSYAKCTMADSAEQVSENKRSRGTNNRPNFSDDSPLLVPIINSDISPSPSVPSQTLNVDTQLVTAIVPTSSSVLGDGVNNVGEVRKASSNAPASNGQGVCSVAASNDKGTCSVGASNNQHQVNAAETASNGYVAVTEVSGIK